ncbi:DUF262 domain-containing protein [Photobacterium halotolerans]|uniref:GmrSD restriction endonucleases N-terminal domain-containing protein n=1 Tax=Photobacterium halotolerans TaxID=265726 RepID=A0A0F5V9K5_9GAMM|nr:DUF262 domain-containing protein [Photobacterium halotolerans]KKC98747.1 hypothetical protein KY46_16605 [Photobacterium halotolerans]
MNIINERIQPSRPTISNLFSEMKAGHYFVDNSFQRRLVWVEKQRIRLIETILIGYPMPEFYLWQQQVNPDSGMQKHSIVDGQQRMSAIMQFIGNEWPLKSVYLDKKEADYSGKSWAELSDENKGKIWNYVINVRTIPSDINREEITALFKRLNETDKSLNPQEIRNAEFNGLFLKASEEVADNKTLQSWDKKWNIFSDNEKRRMADISFASSLLIYQRSGISNDTAKNINKVYDLYNDVYEQKESDLRVINEVLNDIDKLFRESEEIASFFTSTVHLYTLFVAIDYLKSEDINIEDIGPRLLDFIHAYKSDDTTTSRLIADYKLGASGRTLSKLSREKRVESLVDWVRQ